DPPVARSLDAEQRPHGGRACASCTRVSFAAATPAPSRVRQTTRLLHPELIEKRSEQRVELVVADPRADEMGLRVVPEEDRGCEVGDLPVDLRPELIRFLSVCSLKASRLFDQA